MAGSFAQARRISSSFVSRQTSLFVHEKATSRVDRRTLLVVVVVRPLAQSTAEILAGQAQRATDDPNTITATMQNDEHLPGKRTRAQIDRQVQQTLRSVMFEKDLPSLAVQAQGHVVHAVNQLIPSDPRFLRAVDDGIFEVEPTVARERLEHVDVVLLRGSDDAEERRIVELLHDAKTNVMRAGGVVIHPADTRLPEPGTGIGRDQPVFQQTRCPDDVVEPLANECLRHFVEAKYTGCGLSQLAVVRLIEIVFVDLQQMNGLFVVPRIDAGQDFRFLPELVE